MLTDDEKCVETGVGTGTVWKADMLFAARDEAQRRRAMNATRKAAVTA